MAKPQSGRAGHCCPLDAGAGSVSVVARRCVAGAPRSTAHAGALRALGGVIRAREARRAWCPLDAETRYAVVTTQPRPLITHSAAHEVPTVNALGGGHLCTVPTFAELCYASARAPAIGKCRHGGAQHETRRVRDRGPHIRCEERLCRQECMPSCSRTKRAQRRRQRAAVRTRASRASPRPPRALRDRRLVIPPPRLRSGDGGGGGGMMMMPMSFQLSWDTILVRRRRGGAAQAALAREPS